MTAPPPVWEWVLPEVTPETPAPDWDWDLPEPPSQPLPPRRRRRAVVVGTAVASAAVLLGVVAVRALTPDQAACQQATDAPGGHWCQLYDQDFDTRAALGSFTNTPTDDWYLTPGSPYAQSLRSYPDGWGTTKNYSLNYASRTADVVAEAWGAQGVFRLHGHTEEVDGRSAALAGSFYPVLRPQAAEEQEQIAQTYGRYTVRFATTGGYRPGASAGSADGTGEGRYGTAFLLWPANDRWAEGEVDYPEMAWGTPVSGNVHTIGKPEVTATSFETTTSAESTWHTATIEWSPDLLMFSLDGKVVQKVTANVPSTPLRYGFQSGGTLGIPAPELSGYLYVDAIHIEAYEPGTGS